MKEGEQERKATLSEVAGDTRRKASFLERKAFIEQAEVYALAKEFFKAYLRKEQEFTIEELNKELHKIYLSGAIRTRVEQLLEKLSVMEYTDTQYSQAELRILLDELDGIVRDLVVERKRQLPLLTRFANWLFRKRAPVHETVISDFPAAEPNEPAIIELNSTLEEIYAALEVNKVKRAARIYKRLLTRYNSLGSTMQHEFYHKIKTAYEDISKQSE